MTHQEAVDTLATERYLLDDMGDADRHAFEDHFFSCTVCADDLRVSAAMLQGAKAGFAGGPAPARVVPMVVKAAAPGKIAWYRSAVVPWAAAATLAIVTVYQSFWIVPSLRRGVGPLALAPITLRPASRGAEAIVPAGTAPVTLAVELPEVVNGTELAYDLRSADGRPIVSGRAAAPAPGSPLLLLLPSSTLAAPMHYVLSLHEGGPTGRVLGEYRFEVPAR